MELKGNIESDAELIGELLMISKGDPGKDGKDGVSVTHKWNGSVLSITSASGTSSADLKGNAGDPNWACNLHVWESKAKGCALEEGNTALELSYKGTSGQSDTAWDNVSYAESMENVDGTLTLVDAQTVLVSSVASAAVLKGKFVRSKAKMSGSGGSSNTNVIAFYYIPKDASFEQTSYGMGSVAVGYSIDCDKAQKVVKVEGTDTAYVASNNREAYEDEGVYQYLGQLGDGLKGGNAEAGEDGFSPVVTVEETEDGAVITITDKNGTTTATILDGKDGKDGTVDKEVFFATYDTTTWEEIKNAISAGRLVVARLGNSFMGTAHLVTNTSKEIIFFRITDTGKIQVWSVDTSSRWSNAYIDFSNIEETDPTVPSWAKQEKKPTYTASEVGALPNTTKIPSKTSDLTNDSGFITDYTETDPTVPAWAKAESKPSYSKSEVGLGNVDNVKQYSASNPPPYPVTNVNGKTGAVSLSASDVGARPSSWTPTYSDVGAEKSGTAASAVNTHNTKTDAHNDIRLLITALTSRLDALANSDDETLDQMAEVVAYIKSNRDLIDQITTGKVSVTDIVNNLTTNVTNKPLSAAQGVALKALIDAITIPTKLSQLTNDKGYITGYTETDPTVPSWAKAASKPSYSKSEVGLGNVDNVKQYSANNPPPYPVTTVNGKTGDVTLDAAAVGARASTWMPTAANVGAVPTSRTVNGKALSTNISLSASDVGAVPNTKYLTLVGVDASGVQHTYTIYGEVDANAPV